MNGKLLLPCLALTAMFLTLCVPGGRRLQNLVDTVVKRSKMSYMEQYASLEVPAALPPEHSQQASPELAYPGAAAHTGTSALQSGQLSQLVSPNPGQWVRIFSSHSMQVPGLCCILPELTNNFSCRQRTWS